MGKTNKSSYSYVIFPLSLVIFLFSSIFFFTYFYLKIGNFRLLGFDTRAYYTAGVMARNGVDSQFYDLSTQFYWQKKLDPGFFVREAQLMPFFNPPFVALPFIIMSIFPYNIFYYSWGICNIILLLVNIYLLVNIFQTINIPYKKVIILLQSVTFFPAWEAIFQGQTSFILLISFISTFLLLKKGNTFLAGLLLSLLLIKPQIALPSLIVLFFKRRWVTLLGFFSGGFILILASYLMVGLTGLDHYAKLLSRISNFGDSLTVHPRFEPTLRGIIQSLAQTDYFTDIQEIYFISVLPFVGILLWSFRKRWETVTNRFIYQWSLLILITILLSFRANYHELALLLFPIFTIESIFFFNREFKSNSLFIFLIVSLIMVSGSVLAGAITLIYPPFAVPLLIAGVGYLSYKLK